jgi:hypothetical protein
MRLQSRVGYSTDIAQATLKQMFVYTELDERFVLIQFRVVIEVLAAFFKNLLKSIGAERHGNQSNEKASVASVKLVDMAVTSRIPSRTWSKTAIRSFSIHRES